MIFLLNQKTPLHILNLLNAKQKRKFIFLVFHMVFVALLEFTGIALVLPFIRLIGGKLDLDKLPSPMSSYISEFDYHQLVISSGVTIFCLIVLSTFLKIYLSWREQKFVWDLSHRLGLQLHRNVITKPYSFFIEKNSSEIITTLIVETSTTVRGVLLPYAQIISNGIVALLFLILITFLHPRVSFTLLSIGLFVGIILILLLKEKLKIIGNKRLRLERSRFLQLKESIIGIKTVKTSQQEDFFLNKFADVSFSYSKIKPFVNTLNAIPKNVLDIFLFGGVVFMLTFLIIQRYDVTSILPSLTFYVLVGFKLLPTFQNIISSIIMIRFSWPSFQAVFEAIDSDVSSHISPMSTHIHFDQQLSISNCSFAHQQDQNILNDVSIIIPKGKKVGIVGYSGSGKTTLVEILSGLLYPDKGIIKIDQTEITRENIAGLMQLIAFIPQDVFFFDDTILRNITLTKDVEEIDLESLSNLLELLNLTSLINELPQRFDTIVGEQGVKISGGQKQRIGFARALYRKPKILVLDESTSALDYITEKELLTSLRKNFSELTIIKVAHRLKSVEDCDIIYFMDNGSIVTQGTFDEVLMNNSLFKKMVQAGTL